MNKETTPFYPLSTTCKVFSPSESQPQIPEQLAGPGTKNWSGYFLVEEPGEIVISVGADDLARVTIAKFADSPVDLGPEPGDPNGGGKYRIIEQSFNIDEAGYYLVDISYTNVPGVLENLSQLTVEVNGSPMVIGTLRDPNPVTIAISSEIVGEYDYAMSFPIESDTFYKAPAYKMLVKGKDYLENEVSDVYSVLRFMPGYNPNQKDKNYKGMDSVGMVGLAEGRDYVSPMYKGDYELHGTEAPADNGAFVITGTHYLHDGPDSNSKDDVFGAYGCVETYGPAGFEYTKLSVKKAAGLHPGTDTETMMEKLCELKKVTISIAAASYPPVVPTYSYGSV